MTPRHALYVGWVLGMAMRYDLPLVPLVDDEGNYTDRLVLDLAADNVTLTIVVPPPPDDWMSSSYVPDDERPSARRHH